MTAGWIFRAICGALFSICLAAQPPGPVSSAKTPEAPAREPGLYATIATSQGEILVRLFEKESPVTVKNFVDLALGRKPYLDPRTGQKSTKPLYNGLTFHRVIPGFMIQGGDPLGDGTGGTETIPEERHPSLLFDRPGRLAMANAGPDTGSSQFFITEVPTPHLDDRHTIFGQVIEGQEVVDKIARVERNPADEPLTPVNILKVTVKREGPGEPVMAPKPVSAKKPAARKPVTSAKKPAATSVKKPAAPKATKPKALAPAK